MILSSTAAPHTSLDPKSFQWWRDHRGCGRCRRLDLAGAMGEPHGVGSGLQDFSASCCTWDPPSRGFDLRSWFQRLGSDNEAAKAQCQYEDPGTPIHDPGIGLQTVWQWEEKTWNQQTSTNQHPKVTIFKMMSSMLGQCFALLITLCVIILQTLHSMTKSWFNSTVFQINKGCTPGLCMLHTRQKGLFRREHASTSLGWSRLICSNRWQCGHLVQRPNYERIQNWRNLPGIQSNHGVPEGMFTTKGSLCVAIFRDIFWSSLNFRKQHESGTSSRHKLFRWILGEMRSFTQLNLVPKWT